MPIRLESIFNISRLDRGFQFAQFLRQKTVCFAFWQNPADTLRTIGYLRMIYQQLLMILSIFMLCTGSAYSTCIGIGCTCTASASAVSFGTYNPFSATTLTSTGNIAVTCSALVVGLNVSYVIALNAGQNGTFASRAMLAGTSLLNYNLYTTAANTAIWGDGTAGTSTVSDAYLLSLLSVTRNYPVYGTLPGLQNVAPGSYADTITVTVTY